MSELERLLIDLTEYFIRKYNPCRIEGSGCLASPDNPCCKHTQFGNPCPFMQSGVCRNPNIGCKIWFCRTAIEHMDKEAYDTFKLIEEIAKQYNLIHAPYLGENNYVGAKDF